MSAQRDYWQECIAIAAEECGLTLTPEQLDYLAGAAEGPRELRNGLLLAAAAPDLLEVLQAIINDGMHCDVVPHLHRRALEAIAKAMGVAE